MDIKGRVALVLFVGTVAALFAWSGYLEWDEANYGAPTESSRPAPEAEVETLKQLAQLGVNSGSARVTAEHSWYQSRNSVTIYLSRAKFEAIPFPDRPAAMKAMARSWCSSVGQKSIFTVVQFADIATGATLTRSVRCSEARESEPEQ